MISEAAMKAKWCPMARMSPNGTNRMAGYGGQDDQAKCLGSQCAVWEWADWTATTPENLGYCGLKRDGG